MIADPKIWQLATVLDGPHKGETVCVDARDPALGVCRCERSAEVDEATGEFGDTGEVVLIPESYLRFWTSVDSINPTKVSARQPVIPIADLRD